MLYPIFDFRQMFQQWALYNRRWSRRVVNKSKPVVAASMHTKKEEKKEEKKRKKKGKNQERKKKV